MHRYEPSGALHGLLRVRHFTQDDAHIFITEEQLEGQCLAVNDLLLSIYEGLRYRHRGEALDAAGEARRRRQLWDRAEAVMGRVLREIERVSRAPQDRDQPRRGRVLRTEVRVRAARRHRPRLAMRHDAGRLQPAGPAWRLLCRRALGEEDAGDDPPRHLRLTRAVHGRARRELRRAPAAVARAATGDRLHDRVGRGCLRGEWSRRCTGGGSCTADLRNRIGWVAEALAR